MTLRPGTLWGTKQGMRMIHRLPIWITANGFKHDMSETQRSFSGVSCYFFFPFLSSFFLYFQLHWGIINKENCEMLKVYSVTIWNTYTLWIEPLAILYLFIEALFINGWWWILEVVKISVLSFTSHMLIFLWN